MLMVKKKKEKAKTIKDQLKKAKNTNEAWTIYIPLYIYRDHSLSLSIHVRFLVKVIKNVTIMLFLFNNENQRISWSHHRSVSLRSVSLHLPRIWNSESEILYKWTWSHRAK